MKKVTLTLVLGLVWLGLFAQQHVSSICYDSEQTVKVRVAQDLNLETLSYIDKMRFVKKKYNTQHSDYFNEQNNNVQSVKFVSHENYFPKWYIAPTERILGETGITSYFNDQNEYTDGGWLGASGNDANTTYSIDPNGNKISFSRYTQKSQLSYQQGNEYAKVNGILYKYSFQFPGQQEIYQMQQMGFSVSSSPNVVQAIHPEISIEWNMETKTKVITYAGEDAPDTKEYTYFTYDPTFESFLISQEVTVIPLQFSNGDCFDEITSYTYSNYAENCNNIIDNRSVESQEGISVQSINLFPNPVMDRLTVEIPMYNEVTIVKIYNMAGQEVFIDVVNSNNNKLEVNTSSLSRGLYVVSVFQGSTSLTNKFSKI